MKDLWSSRSMDLSMSINLMSFLNLLNWVNIWCRWVVVEYWFMDNYNICVLSSLDVLRCKWSKYTRVCICLSLIIRGEYNYTLD